MIYMTLFVTGLLLIACNQTDKQVSQTQADAEQAAVQIAEMWLALMDEGKFEESWDESSSMFKNSVTKEQWAETMRINRPLLGKVLQRNVKTKSYETNVPGKPDREHVAIQFQTKFENKAIGIETITPAKDSDGVWRVWGYFIK